MNIDERIDVVEARTLIEAVTIFAKSCAFTKLEAHCIAKICLDCANRLEQEGRLEWEE